jgi:competence protein ComGC
MLPAADTRQMTRIEWLIVLVTLGAVAAIAIPRMTRGAGDVADSVLAADLRMLRGALDMYATDHGGSYPAVEHVVEALTMYSDETGTIFSATADAGRGVTLGPYLREVPRLAVRCRRRGESGIASRDAVGIGWIYTIGAVGFGEIRANTTTEADSRGTPYAAY